MMESLIENFKKSKVIRSDAFFFSDEKKYQRNRENDSRHLWSAIGIGVVLEKNAKRGGKVLKQMDQFKLKQMDQFKLKKEPRLNWDSNLSLECKQEKFVKMHPPSKKKFSLLNIRISKESNDDPLPTTWHCIDLSNIRHTGDNWFILPIDLKIRMPQNSPYPRMCVALGSVIYIIGGNPSITRIYYLDTSNPLNEWLEGPSMNVHREIGSAVVHDGKIYVFGGFVNYMKQFGEVYDPVLNSWEPMSDPPEELEPLQGRFSGIYKDRKILVHPCSNKTLYAYDVVDKSWEVLDRHFGYWPFRGVIMDDILYVFDYMDLEICVYDLVGLKWLKPINLDRLKCFSRTKDYRVLVLRDALLFKVEAKVLCLVYPYWQRGEGLEIYCKKFTMEKTTQVDGNAVLEAKVFSSTVYNLEENDRDDGGSCLNYVVM